jgi:hypothetical protein
LRRGERSRNRNLSPQRLEKLHAIYSGRFMPGLDAAPPSVEARRATNLFVKNYNHVIPFDRRVLEDVWGRCTGEDCEAERAQVEGLLWGLDESASR